MASKKEIISVLGAIKTIYPFYAKDNNDVELLVNTWSVLLADYDDETVNKAIMECLKRCKMPPTPADVIEEAERKEKATPMELSELWSEYNEALMQANNLMYEFGFTRRDINGLTQGQNARNRVHYIYDNLSDKLKAYIGSEAMFMKLARHYEEADSKYERNNFMKAVATIVVRPVAKIEIDKTKDVMKMIDREVAKRNGN